LLARVFPQEISMGQEGEKSAVRGSGVAVWPGAGAAGLRSLPSALGRCQEGAGQGVFGGEQRL